MSPTVGGAELPVAPADAVAAGKFSRVPLLIGTNHDEGRTFSQGLAGLNEQQYDGLIQSQYGANAPKVLAQYPFSAFPSPYTAAYAAGAVWTDSGFIGGIGGCAGQNLEQQFRTRTLTFAYQFDDRHAPEKALEAIRVGIEKGAEEGYRTEAQLFGELVVSDRHGKRCLASSSGIGAALEELRALGDLLSERTGWPLLLPARRGRRSK